MQLWVTYTENPETTGLGVTNMHGRFKSIHTKWPRSYRHHGPFEVDARPGDTVMVVWCTFADGSTFGCTEGQFDCLGVVKTQAEVNLLKAKAKTIHNDYFGGLEAVYVDPVAV